jgi:transposase-like protein
VGLDTVDEQLAGRARAGRLQLAGEGGLLAQLTKRLVESALEGEITDHLGYAATTPRAGTAATPATGTGRRRC